MRAAGDNLVLDPASEEDLRAGLVDPRIIAVLEALSREHTITVSALRSGHGRFTAGGQISSHCFGRGVDIVAIDGLPVDASNLDARAVAAALQDLDPAIRPDEIGSPWAISGPGYFTDASHQDHLHIGFSTGRADWAPPAPPLLTDPRVVLEPQCAADLHAGRVDPRVVALLARLARAHTITVSSLCTGHPRFTAAGEESSHHRGRAADITAFDGAPVNAANVAAREIAVGLRRLEPAIRPDEIGTPWAIAGPGYWTDAAQQDHLHVGFKTAGAWAPPPPAADAPGRPRPARAGRGRVPGAKALAAAVEAEKRAGAPYQPGGSTPETGFDASGLVQWCYAQAGVELPRVGAEQLRCGAAVEPDALLPGDLVLRAGGPVGIALGRDRFVLVADAVAIAAVDRLTEARRLVPAGAGDVPDREAVARAQARVARDAAEVRRPGSRLFAAIEEQEGRRPVTPLDPLPHGP